ncbi:ras guanine nucleotide exchange factor domain-containing protein [Mucor mucedo]|uniref:ras guanine nucleotide exchange factor domain-containing protein n=1 Tax=Mucor mucedo TaxID=29922 RepID=UPI00221E7CC2|nr:ras guanine nucleotide exchange factor domain-containing protein [Mucor mucedo]KAI7891125.1 ras guanine nucleotide exchange factor domain-containing protein [Mucor mucedo]
MHSINDRFESDLTQESDTMLPTVRQQRIRWFFCLWLSQYWGDFQSSATRRMMMQFLERLRSYDRLTSVIDVLLPLAIREPALRDKDSGWGMCDDDHHDMEHHKKSRKKDSGYNEWIPPHPKGGTIERTRSLRRAVSTSHPKLPCFKSLVASLAITDRRRNSVPCRLDNLPTAVFGGGLVSIVQQQEQQKSLPVDPYQVLSSLSPLTLAQQLTWIEADIFRRIQPRDFLRHLWSCNSSHHPHEKNPVLASIEHFNFVSGWIASLVVNQTLLDRRVTVFEFCLQLAVDLRGLNNFNTLMAVLAGINSAAVLRLKLTRDKCITRNKKLFHVFLELESLMSSERSFSNYRSTLKQTQVPGIPYLGIHQQDLVSLGEANKDHKIDGKVHWKKFRLMGDSILQMMRFQYPTYAFEPNPFLLYFIGHQSIPTEDERYEVSKQIEPRIGKPSLSTSSSTTSSRWLSSLK